jgi:hypothetical protein
MNEPLNPTPEDAQLESLKLLYAENSQFARTFLEWRHKVISIYFLTTSGILVAAKWFWESTSLHAFTSIALAVGAIFCFALALMDHVNHNILKSIYRIGSQAEKQLNLYNGIYSFMDIRQNSKSSITYSRILLILFVGSGVAFTIAAIVVI